MRIYDVLNPYDLLCEAEMLEETLSTDFKIGFELEGVCTQEEMGGDFLPPYHSSRPPEGRGCGARPPARPRRSGGRAAWQGTGAGS